MSAIERTEQLSLEDFIQHFSREPFELVEGERKPLMPNILLHGLTIRTIFLLLYNFCTAHHLGEVITETPYVLLYGSGWVKGARVPDLMFIAAERWRQYTVETPDWQRKPFLLIPDFVIEIVSPNDLYTEIQEKVDRYRADGVRLTWIVDPLRSRVEVYEGDEFATLGKDNTLTGGNVLPGLEIPLAQLFSEEK